MTMKIARLSIPAEALVWIAGLAVLAVMEPGAEAHFSVCPLALAGFEWCPGCGLGRSITFLFHGDLHHSFESHPLGLFAIIVLLFRIVQLIKSNTEFYGKNNRHSP
jgi:hypothetical protein